LVSPTFGDDPRVYLDWRTNPIVVSRRRMQAGIRTWEVAGPMLYDRVRAAVAPLVQAGWELNGSIASATKWDVSCSEGGDHYEGCWVTLRREQQAR
jgi:hypothetical protein